MAKEKKKEEKPDGAAARSGNFFAEAWKELKKVQAPSREETTQFTIQVLFVIFVFSFFLGIVDLVLGWVMKEMLT